MALSRQVKKRRSRVGVALAAGLGIMFVSYFPGFYWGKPEISLVAAVAVTIFVATRCTTVRQGWIRGVVLGVLAGMGSYTGMHNRLAHYVQWRQSSAQTQPAAAPAEDRESASQPAEPTTQAAQPTTAPQPLSEEEWQQIREIQRKLPVISILPTVLLCTFVAGLFAKMAVRRRERMDAKWR